MLAELEADGRLHLALVYRGDLANTAKFMKAQDNVIAALYPMEPEQDNSSGPESQESEEGAVPKTESVVE